MAGGFVFNFYLIRVYADNKTRKPSVALAKEGKILLDTCS
jgi:hypothetical protein